MYDGSVAVTLSTSSPPIADVEVLGDGDYAVDFGTLEAVGDNESLVFDIDNIQQNDSVTIVFSSSDGLSHGAVRVIDGSSSSIVGDSEAITGSSSVWRVPATKRGCAAIVVNGYVFARIALYDDSTAVETCLGLALPISARGNGVSELPITINGNVGSLWAGWQSALPAGGVVRVTGFNLPRTLTSYSGATPTTINAEGGDYGIEFTIPQGSDSVAVFDETFWLYIR